MGPISFWSFSSVAQFEKCPYSLYLGRVEKSPTPPREETHPLERGNRVHKAAELYIKGEGPLVRELVRFQPHFEQLAERYATGSVEVEGSWWFRSDWSVADGWDDPLKWCIVKCDVASHESDTHMNVIDWKTGKSWGKEVAHGQQMQLYAIAAFMRYPEINTVTVQLGYLDEKTQFKEKNYLRTQIAELSSRFAARGQALVDAQHFPPKPNRSNCKYCDFGPTNGTGVCPYGVEV